MEEEGMNYPLHLGVTEAGDGEDGRIKSAVGIGTLLEDGIGDTIRVSLTEEPEFEAPVAISLADRYKYRQNHQPIVEIEQLPKDPFIYQRRETFEVAGIGGETVPKIFTDFSDSGINNYKDLESVGYIYSPENDKWNLSDQACDLIYIGNKEFPFDAPNSLKVVYDFEKWITLKNQMKGFPFYNSIDKFNSAKEKSFVLNFVEVSINHIFSDQFKQIKNNPTVVLELVTGNEHGMAELRRAFFELLLNDVKNPVIIRKSYSGIDEETLQLYSSTDFGALLIDGFGDGICLSGKDKSNITFNKKFINRTSFGILQACRVRISKTEYIACPSCGRTLFNLVEVTNKIRKRTEHLKGIKIAIMGCIVNGPGEMADADYGYVGSGPAKITLYRGKEVVKRNINSQNALDELIGLIKEDQRWVEPINLQLDDKS